MPQSLANILLHLVFSTKGRASLLSNGDLRSSAHAYLGACSLKLDCQALMVGGMPDHVNILARFSRTISVAEWVKELKRASTEWIRRQPGARPDFHWQAGYGVFSVSQSNADGVIQYIRDQASHHAVRSFQDEFRILLERNGLKWDEAYVWD